MKGKQNEAIPKAKAKQYQYTQYTFYIFKLSFDCNWLDNTHHGLTLLTMDLHTMAVTYST